MSAVCWLWDNGWATVDDNGTLAGYMDDGEEQRDECRSLRGIASCPVHGIYTPGTWRHLEWCPTPTGHDGDCWAEDKRVNRPEPEPVMVIVDATTGERTEIW